MAIATYGPGAVDWGERIDLARLRDERLARLKAALEQSDLGAVLCFDFGNIRYMTATHIGTWAMDKLIRFALLTRGGEPVIWDFGSAARHHQLYNPWLDRGAAPVRGPCWHLNAARSLPPGSRHRRRGRPQEEAVVVGNGCEIITKFPAEELLVARRRYWTTGGVLSTLREAQSHLNTRSGGKAPGFFL